MPNDFVISHLGAVYNVASLAPLVFGGAALTVFKSFFKTEDELKRETYRIREVLIERLCQSYDRIVPVTSDSFSELMAGLPTRDEVRTILRGDGRGRPDITYEHFALLFKTSDKLKIIDIIRNRHRICHDIILICAVSGPLLFVLGTAFQSLRGDFATIGTGLFCIQAGLVVFMRKLATILDGVENS